MKHTEKPLPLETNIHLKTARKYMGHDRKLYASIIGVSPERYALIESQDETITRPQIIVLSVRANLSLHFLLFGQGSPAIEPEGILLVRPL